MTGEERKAFYTSALRDAKLKLQTIQEEGRMVYQELDAVTQRVHKYEAQERETMVYITAIEFLLESDVE